MTLCDIKSSPSCINLHHLNSYCATYILCHDLQQPEHTLANVTESNTPMQVLPHSPILSILLFLLRRVLFTIWLENLAGN